MSFYVKYGRARYERIQLLIARYKDQPCADCGGRFPSECMDFDHVRGVKLFTIGAQVVSHSLEKILAEIEKCDVVCSNCHRIRTKKRANHGKHNLTR